MMTADLTKAEWSRERVQATKFSRGGNASKRIAKMEAPGKGLARMFKEHLGGPHGWNRISQVAGVVKGDEIKLGVEPNF